MAQRTTACALLGVVVLLATAEAGTAPAPQSDDLLACFVIRTYRGHDAAGGAKNSLQLLLRTLQVQTVARWVALIVVMDAKPFDNLQRLLGAVGDTRVRFFAEWAGPAYAAKNTVDGTWAPQYHGMLYNLTDAAIRQCPDQARWVVVTNGDNQYDSHFLEHIAAAPPGSDAVAFDYYSRYQRPTGWPCMRFASGPGLPACKTNEMRLCHMDLASVAWSRSRLVTEGRRFGTMDLHGTGDASDGLLANQVVASGWKVHFVSGLCLVNHSPSPQQCAAQGGVWDDTRAFEPASFGGECISQQDIEQRVRSEQGAIEVSVVDLSFDPGSFGLQGRERLQIACARRTDRGAWRGPQAFGRLCAARVDLADFPTDLPPHPWDSFLTPDLLASPPRAAEPADSAQ